MTGPENERLAVLENQYASLQHDVTEIKGDVKSLVATQSALATTLAVREAAERQTLSARASTGVWIRAMIPWGIALTGFLMAMFNTLSRLDIT